MQSQTFYDQLRGLIARDELGVVLYQLRELIRNSPKLDEAIVQSARHESILHQIRLGTVDHQQANLTKNQIRSGLLDLIRELESQSYRLEQQSDDYHFIIEKIKNNRGIGTSELLKSKTAADLDEKELARLFEKERAVRVFEELGLLATRLAPHKKLLHLSLAENGHLFKGTFLCLGKRNQIHAICHTATESKFIFFKGTERSIILALETLNGNLLQQFEKMLFLLRVHIPLGRDREKNEDVYEIPMVALREFVANAFVHRDYGDEVQSYVQVELFDDRLEIKSPGHLPQNVDVNKIEGTVLTNPVIAAVFHLFNYVERAGTGIKVAQQALQGAGLKSARIENIDHPTMVKVTVFRRDSAKSAKKKGRLFFDAIREGFKSLFS